MSATATGFAPCKNASRYVQQLVSHWSHKMAASWNDGHAEFLFSDVVSVAMDTSEQGIAITIKTGQAEESIQMRGVIERHLDRFAFREAPLSYEWTGDA